MRENKTPPPAKNLATDWPAEKEQWLAALVGREILYRIVTK